MIKPIPYDTIEEFRGVLKEEPSPRRALMRGSHE